MTIPEIITKYKDNETDEFHRKDKPYFSANIQWLKGLYAYGNKESQDIGFFIPSSMIEDAQADDWMVTDEKRTDI